ncbi:GNAT family N-acetyltransferase [Pseudonocardia sp.]|uniref:GNAT family N-acetyltransferase n=1 Tax=Pseudonocardia sp. TaxID=60912 RepID=UPI003D0E3E55
MDVTLVPFDEPTLDALVAAALADADPDEVTPPLGAGWTAERLAWLRDHHLAPRPHRETWAVVAGGAVVGAVRLTPVADPAESPTRPDEMRNSQENGPAERSTRPDEMRNSRVEVGMWLVRSARGRGVGAAALRLALDLAAGRTVVAHTTVANAAAVAALRRLGFVTSSGAEPGAVRAERAVPRA